MRFRSGAPRSQMSRRFGSPRFGSPWGRDKLRGCETDFGRVVVLPLELYKKNYALYIICIISLHVIGDAFDIP